jgi:hypothetical protein
VSSNPAIIYHMVKADMTFPQATTRTGSKGRVEG